MNRVIEIALAIASANVRVDNTLAIINRQESVNNSVDNTELFLANQELVTASSELQELVSMLTLNE